ncbi:MAG: 4-(cytidine 5'-diphospho)-2-C-methyl-D-erythritol kinase [Bacillota bacterium]|nr:4-(cytidine 5'-diphospho)-2-C-methyl-D-erythritol kinase [Bacillota bacterium]
MLIKAYAKVNISLDIVGKREEDGYHLLEMIMQTIDLYDSIIIEKDLQGININCNKPYIPVDGRNLAYKAAKLFIDTYSIDEGVNISIKKNIPVAAGLAGGSTDAAAVLRGMRNLFKINASDKELMELGVTIGADVPYCIVGGTALCKGIGEEVAPLKAFKNHILILVKPNFGVSTKEVYKSIDISKIHRHPNTKGLIQAIDNNNLSYIGQNMKNVLENVTLRRHNLIKNIKSEMLKMGALGSMMSGSGPTVFAFFDDMLKAQRCFERFRQEYKETYITRTI